MRFTHFGHACVLTEVGGARFLFDPGEWSAGYAEARDLDAILITHKHFDHLDPEGVRHLAESNPDARVIADPESARELSGMGLETTVASPGASFEVGGVTITAVGGQHAVVHAEIPVLRNTGYIVGQGEFYHPGDSFFVPDCAVDALGLPTGGPWLKVSEAVDFLRLVAPRVALPIHELSLAKPQAHYRMFTNLAPGTTRVRVPDRGAAMEI